MTNDTHILSVCRPKHSRPNSPFPCTPSPDITGVDDDYNDAAFDHEFDEEDAELDYASRRRESAPTLRTSRSGLTSRALHEAITRVWNLG